MGSAGGQTVHYTTVAHLGRFKAIKFVSFHRSLGICGRPIVPLRGPLILHGNSFLDGDEVQFSCVANYDLFGSQRSRCNGQKWNTSIPECKGLFFFYISYYRSILAHELPLDSCHLVLKKR